VVMGQSLLGLRYSPAQQKCCLKKNVSTEQELEGFE